MRLPDSMEEAKLAKERKQLEQRGEPTPMTASERYAMLERFASNHRHSLSDMPGRGTTDMLSQRARLPNPFRRL